MTAAQHRRVRGAGVHLEADLGDGGGVADAAVRDHGVRAVHLGAQGQDVPEGAGAVLATGLHDHHVVRLHRVDGPLLGVEAAAELLGQVLALGDVAQGLRVAEDAPAPVDRARAVDGRVLDAALLQLGGEGGHRDGVDLGAQLRGQQGAVRLRGARDPVAVLVHRGRRRRRGLRGQTGGLAGAPGLLALHVVHLRLRAERGQGVLRVDDRRHQAAGGRCAGGAGGVHLHLDDVARLGHGGAGGGAGEDDVALLERHELREVGHELAEREDEALGGVVLDDLAVDPGAHAQGGRVQARGGDHRGAERGVAVAGLVLDVGALVRVAEVVEAPVVGGGDAGDVRPALLRADAPGGAADDQRDLALVGEQLGAGGALDGVAAAGDGGAGLEEVAGGLRGPAPLGDAGGVVQVDGEHLARPVLPDGEVVLGDGGRGVRCALRHGRDRIRSRGPGEEVARPADAPGRRRRGRPPRLSGPGRSTRSPPGPGAARPPRASRPPRTSTPGAGWSACPRRG